MMCGASLQCEHFSFLMVWKRKNAQNKVLKVILGKTMMKIIVCFYRFILRNRKTDSNKTLALIMFHLLLRKRSNEAALGDASLAAARLNLCTVQS